MSFDKISTLSVRETFVREIENKILSGELKPGDKLPPARQLCKIMGVSLTVVNAGVSELASKGFVEVKPRHGTYVADYIENGNTETFFAIIRYNGGKINAKEFRSFTESRVALDPLIAELVIKRASDEEIASLGGIIEEIKKSEELHETCRLITHFYHKMYITSQNSFCALLYNSTMSPQIGMYEMFIEKNGLQPVIDNMEAELKCLIARDIEHARMYAASGQMSAIEGPYSVI